MNEATTPESGPAEYRVLARKYRPADFSTLIGQQALVRTLSNAIASGRLAQAYVLTGVRGVGKTTTARIIARALNCIGPDGTGGPTVDPCGVCEHCRAIAEDRHVDVLEMDAASRTGVGDIRELLESVRYRPTSARYKIYIVDEVHMLSTAAFNALLKTLEEPPEHVKFIFATTEIRKVPVTVLSRCQRFDLRRVDAETLAAHFRRIIDKEGASIEDAAIALLARAADGSVRDGLSLLDQAIAHGGGTVSEAQVRDMLGLADRALVFDLFDAVMKGDVGTALTILGDQYNAGADPVVVLNDMLELTHWLTRLKVTPESVTDPMAAETERVRGRDMANRLTLAVLTRTWQMLLKAVGEARNAGSPLQAVEMALIRLAYAADLPSPAEALARLNKEGPARAPQGPAGGGGAGAGVSAQGPAAPPPGPLHGPTALGPTALGPTPMAASGGGRAPEPMPQGRVEVPPWEAAAPALPDPYPPAPRGEAAPPTFEKLIALFMAKREAVLGVQLERNVHLVRYDPANARLEFRPAPGAEKDLGGRVGKCLEAWTGRRWGVLISNEAGEPTVFEKTLTGAQAHPLVQAVLATFPSASIGVIRDLAPGDGAAGAAPLDGAPVTEPDDDINGEDDL
ncbi:DNA polymerase III subunit gamma/tau [Novispirillum sp. DQ9]|uniref:DNA polymerase III subunit gamma/tau n=1 Tax=Novispirillum sp. DQ9 TaxID=3398612 RepID=UPI003C7E136F